MSVLNKAQAIEVLERKGVSISNAESVRCVVREYINSVCANDIHVVWFAIKR